VVEGKRKEQSSERGPDFITGGQPKASTVKEEKIKFGQLLRKNSVYEMRSVGSVGKRELAGGGNNTSKKRRNLEGTERVLEEALQWERRLGLALGTMARGKDSH